MREHLRRLGAETAVYGLSALAIRFSGLVLVPVYARIFTRSEYGAVSLVNATVMVATIFVILGLDTAAGRWFWDSEEAADRKRTLASWAWCQMLASLLVAAILWLLSPQLAQILAPGETTAFRLAVLTLPFSVFGVVLTNRFRLERRAWAAASFAFGMAVVNIGATLAFVIGLDWGVIGVFAGQVCSSAVGTVVALVILRDWVSPRRASAARLRAMFKYAAPLIPAALAAWAIGFSDRYFVEYYASADAVGIYQMANSVASLVALVTLAFQQAWGPFALSIHSEEGAGEVYSGALLAYAAVTSTAAAGLSMLAPEVIRVAATSKFEAASVAVPWLAFGLVAVGLGYVAGLGPLLARRSRPVAAAIICAGLLNVILNFALIPALGITGAAIATLAAQAAIPAYLFVRSQALHRIPYRFGPAVALLAAGLVVGVAGERWHPASVATGVVAKCAATLAFAAVAVAVALRHGRVRETLEP